MLRPQRLTARKSEADSSEPQPLAHLPLGSSSVAIGDGERDGDGRGERRHHARQGEHDPQHNLSAETKRDAMRLFIAIGALPYTTKQIFSRLEKYLENTTSILTP